jgi:hypothetical protein
VPQSCSRAWVRHTGVAQACHIGTRLAEGCCIGVIRVFIRLACVAYIVAWAVETRGGVGRNSRIV